MLHLAPIPPSAMSRGRRAPHGEMADAGTSTCAAQLPPPKGLPGFDREEP